MDPFVLRQWQLHCLLSEQERTQAEDARQNTLDILRDLQTKKERLMEEKGEGLWPVMSNSSLITKDLVNKLAEILQSVRFINKNHWSTYYSLREVGQDTEEGTFLLNQEFWQSNESMRPNLLMHEALILFNERSQPWSLQTRPFENIMTEFFKLIDHGGVYENGCFSCCGETSRFSVCEESLMTEHKRVFLWDTTHSSKGDLEQTIERTRYILTDALNKKHSLLVENPEELRQRGRFRSVPLISPRLVKTLIQALQQVEINHGPPFKYRLDNADDQIDIRFYPLFCKEKEYLGRGSRPGSLILELSHALGYEYHFVSASRRSIGNSCNVQPWLSAYDICCAFETWMNHAGRYLGGAYTCCGEVSRDSVCEASEMSQRLV